MIGKEIMDTLDRMFFGKHKHLKWSTQGSRGGHHYEHTRQINHRIPNTEWKTCRQRSVNILPSNHRYISHRNSSIFGYPSLPSKPPAPYSTPDRPAIREAPDSSSSPKQERKTRGHVASACVPYRRAHLR
jgi:hypothetical protein